MFVLNSTAFKKGITQDGLLPVEKTLFMNFVGNILVSRNSFPDSCFAGGSKEAIFRNNIC